MTNRYEEAIACQDATNPSDVAHTWLDCHRDFFASPAYTGTDSVKRDPALRLIAYKLADLHGANIDMARPPMVPGGAYDRAYEECKRMVGAEKVLAPLMDHRR